MRVLYLTTLENTYKNDIHANQVLGLSGHGVDYQFLFISPFFILNRKGLSINRNTISQDKVKEVKVPILSYHLCMHVLIIPYFLLVALIPFIYNVKKVKPEVVHCRNMISTLLAVMGRLITRDNYKIVCDPRSVYVEECVITKTFRYNGFNFRVWKKLEIYLYSKSDACIGLSPFFKDYLKQYNNASYFVPALVKNQSIFSSERRKNMRNQYNLCSKDVVCCYIGSIDLWHSSEKLFFYLDKIKETLGTAKDLKIVFLSGNQKVCDQLVDKYGRTVLKAGRVKPVEVIDYLLLSDLGIVPGSDNSNACYDMLYNTMISSKAEEFLVAGLPILVNEKITSLVFLAETNHAGSSDPSKLTTEVYDRDAISQCFCKMFGVNTVVDEFKVIYEKITQ